MAQKILAGRCADPMLAGAQVSVKVDQIVLSRAPLRAVAEAREAGLKKTSAEVAIVYDTQCVGSATRKRAEDVQAAIELSARIPAARLGGAIEIRPAEKYW